MYLLNSTKILEYQHQTYGAYLHIKNFSEKQLKQTAYYFRLGPMYKLRNTNNWIELTIKKPVIEFKPGNYFIVQSFESFRLSEKVLGILGISTDVISLGLRLINAPFIDPCYDRALQFGLHNPLNETICINFLDVIGKVCFFDISDTYPIKLDKSLEEKMGERLKVENYPADLYDPDTILAADRDKEKNK